MIHFFNGILWGLFLAILVGPIVFAIVQTTLEQGTKAGMLVGLGIWISDLLFILASYLGVAWVVKITKWANFELTLGIAGGLVLLFIGGSIFFSTPPSFNKNEVYASKGKWLSHWMKGFLINTINPFTVLFWLSVMTTTVEEKGLNETEVGWFAGGILFTIMASDSLKVLFALKVRKWLTPQHILAVRKVSGFALGVFGLILIFRVIF